MEELLVDIDTKGYGEALDIFFKKNPNLRSYILDYRRADWVSHCISNNNFRCLDIGSGLGNISEILSYIYRQIYSLEAVKERIEFQKRKFRNSYRTNIMIIRGNALQLPFPDGYFDLVVCNGVLEWIGMLNKHVPPREGQLSFLREVKRVVSNNGCVYIGIENRFGLQFFLGGKDHSGLSYTSLLPRSLANIVVKLFGSAGGIYGDKSTALKEKGGYYTYTYSYKGYSSLLGEAGFRVRSYWALPGYVAPFFSGNIQDKIAIKGFLRYLKSINPRSISPRPQFKLAVSLLEKMDKYTLSLITKLFIPCFLFYCHKGEIPETFEDIIQKNSSYENITTLSGDKHIGYIMYDAKSNPKKLVRLKRLGHELPASVPNYDKTAPGPTPMERAWAEDWIDGRTLDPINFQEAHAAIVWLMAFQENTQTSNPMSKEDIYFETNAVRNKILQIPDLNRSKYRRWLDDYESYLLAHDLHKCSEHGDFFYSNILINPKIKKVAVIDWNYFREEGDPLFDFVFFLICAMQFPTGGNTPVQEFKQNLDGNGSFSKNLSGLHDILNGYFNFKLDLHKLIRYTLLRYTIRKYSERGQNDETTITFRNILKTLPS